MSLDDEFALFASEMAALGANDDADGKQTANAAAEALPANPQTETGA